MPGAVSPLAGGFPHNNQRGTVAGDSRADEERWQWAKKRAFNEKRRVDAFNAQKEVELESDDEYSESELVGGDESIDSVAALVIAELKSTFYNCQHAARRALSLPLFLRGAARLHRVSQVSQQMGNCE